MMKLPDTTTFMCSMFGETDSVRFSWGSPNRIFLDATQAGKETEIALDRDQAAALRNQLTQWLEREEQK